MTPDPAIDVIREARRLISHDVANDAARLIERYREMQANFAAAVRVGQQWSKFVADFRSVPLAREWEQDTGGRTS